jgi:nitrogen fixation/metabolism regulation signal transduction histidine kinase
LFRFTEITNKKLKRFLESVEYSDFSVGFSHDNSLGKSFKELNKAFNAVLDAFRQARAEKEENLNYLNTVVQHVTTGLLSFDEEGNVGLINNTAKRFLSTPQIRNILEISETNVSLFKLLKNLKAGEKTLFRLRSDLHLAIQTTELKLRGRTYKLVAFQNIHSELQTKEVEAWQNLTRVLRHEIMNSITPIASLTGTLNEILEEDIEKRDDEFCRIPTESVDDLEEGLQTIENRSKGLIKFVDAYRDYTSIPKPKFGMISVEELFERLSKLLKSELEKEGIEFNCSIERDNMEITADQELIEMVLINLLKNAKEALNGREEPKIDLSCRKDANDKISIEVKDNGPGIIAEAAERIFIPFYTTKKEGSGIGLALSRQIMQLHNGTLTVKSEPNIFTIFSLKF